MSVNIEIWIVFIGLCLMMGMLIADWLRPGFVLFSGVVLFMCTGILTPREALAGFANEGMITVALLFLVSEGVRRSDALGHLVKWLLPVRREMTVRKGYLRILPTIAAVSAFLNNTPVVVVFIPIIKQWARRTGLAVRKFLIPLSYAAILGGMCTLIGTSTNLVVHGMMLDEGFEGFSMFELGKVGLCIAIVGLLYMILLGDKRLPDDSTLDEPLRDEESGHEVEAVLGPRFPGINRTLAEFDFRSHYGAEIRALRRGGEELRDLKRAVFRAGDTLVLETDGAFVERWGDSRVFLMLSNGSEHRPASPRWKKWLALTLLVVMIGGATFGSMPFMADLVPGMRLDMFFWVCVVAVLMACFGIFPAKKYTKFISWDILVTIASALAISRAMVNSGLADWIAARLTGLAAVASPWAVLAVLYITTNLITEFITNNAAAAFAFPVALSAAAHLGVDPMPFFVAICIAASCSFSSPIGYQTNMIVQGIGNYRFRDFLRIGLPLNLIAFAVSMVLIPWIWPFEPLAA